MLNGWAQDLRSAVAEGRATGARVAGSVDVDYGATRPAAAVLIDRVASAKVAAVMPDFYHRSAYHERQLRRLGPPLLQLRKRDAEIEAAIAPAKLETASQVNNLGEEHAGRRHDRRRSAVFGFALLMVLGLGDIAFAEAVLELMGLSTTTTWMVAGVLGLGQLGVLHVLGELNARSRKLRDSAERVGRRNAVLVLALAVPALALVGLLGWLRADYLSTQEALAGVSAGHVGFGVAMAAFAAVQLLLDGLAFAVGYRFGDPLVKAVVAARSAQCRLEQVHRFLVWRLGQREGRLAAVLAGAIGWCNTTKAVVHKAYAEQRASSAALYVGITENSDPQTAAVFSDEEQLSGLDAESDKRILQVLEEIDARRAELEALARTYDYPSADPVSTPPALESDGATGAEDEEVTSRHSVEQDATRSERSANGKGDYRPGLTKEFK